MGLKSSESNLKFRKVCENSEVRKWRYKLKIVSQVDFYNRTVVNFFEGCCDEKKETQATNWIMAMQNLEKIVSWNLMLL